MQYFRDKNDTDTAHMTEPCQYSIGVFGSGRMGADIVDYLSDFPVRLTWICVSEEEREEARRAYQKKIGRRHRNGLMDDALFELREKSSVVSSSPAECADCDIIIEAIIEDEDAKRNLFAGIEAHARRDAVIVSNTSSINLSRLIENAVRRERFAGLHFFFPVRYRDIAELVLTGHTDAAAAGRLRQFLSFIGRFYLEMGERDAFILNRVVLECQAQACRFCEEGAFMPRDIDGIVKQSFLPAGIFELFDSVGIDVVYRSVVNYTESLADREFYIPMLRALQSLVSSGRLGRKNGAGFYDYNETDARAEDRPAVDATGAGLLLNAIYINSAFKALERGTWRREDLEYALAEYTGARAGPFAYAGEPAKREMRAVLKEHYKKTGFEAYRPSMLF